MGGWHVRGPASDISAWCLCLCLYALSICSSSAFPLCARTPVRLPMDRPIHHAHSCHFCSSVDSCALSSRLLFTGGRLTLFQTDLLEMCRETQNVAGLQGALLTQFCHTHTHTHTHTLSLSRTLARSHARLHAHPPTHPRVHSLSFQPLQKATGMLQEIPTEQFSLLLPARRLFMRTSR